VPQCAHRALSAGTASAAQLPVSLGAGDDFAVLAGSTVTNGGFSTVNGDLGVSPGTAVTGFPPGKVNGTIHAADPVAAAAQGDLTAAYNDAAGRTPPNALPADVGGQTLIPGVYNSGAALGLTGTLTLDGQGDPNAVFVFQVGSALTTAVSSQVNLINGAQASNVFWQIGSSATLGTSSGFAGTIMALSSISMNDSVTLNGRALARNGAVTLINDTITARSAQPQTVLAAGTDGTPLVTQGQDGWIVYHNLLTGTVELQDKTIAVTNGHVGDDGCTISGSSTAGAAVSNSDDVIVAEQMAYNPLTCQSQDVTGRITADEARLLGLTSPTSDPLPSSGTRAKGPSALSGAKGPSALSGAKGPFALSGAKGPFALSGAKGPFALSGAKGPSAALTGTNGPQGQQASRGFTSTSWVDPVHLTITATTSNVEWYLGNKTSRARARNKVYKFALDNWKQNPAKLPADSVYRTAEPPPVAGPQGSLTTIGWGSKLGVEFKNRDFAAAVDRAGVFSGCTEGPRGDKHLATFYNESRVIGRDDGRVSGYSTDRRAGACSNLVRHVRTVGNGWSDGPGYFG